MSVTPPGMAPEMPFGVERSLSLQQIREAFAQAESCRVLVVGDVILDRYIDGRVERISPEAPIPILIQEQEMEILGGAGNVHRNLVRLGIGSVLLTVLGEDEGARKIRDLAVEAPHARVRIVTETARQTPIKTRMGTTQNQILRLDQERFQPVSAAAEAALLAHAEQESHHARALILSDYQKGLLSESLTQKLVELGRSRNLPVLVDPRARSFAHYRGANYVTPNRAELSAVSGGLPTGTDAEIERACRKIMATYRIRNILATRSENGMSLVTAKQAFHLPTRAREVFNVTGAGDTVVAAFTAALALGIAPPAAAEFANRAAGVVVAKRLTATATLEEILDEYGGRFFPQDALYSDKRDKLASWPAAEARVRVWKSRGQSVCFTNGCFDFLHAGHLHVLEAARAQGDRLVVGLNSDDSVRRLKGPTRPVCPLAERERLLAAFACVDLVVVFDQDTPLELIELLKPDVLVKGGDYQADQVVGRQSVEEAGGRLHLVPLLEGYSTTTRLAGLQRRWAPLAGAGAGVGDDPDTKPETPETPEKSEKSGDGSKAGRFSSS